MEYMSFIITTVLGGSFILLTFIGLPLLMYQVKKDEQESIKKYNASLHKEDKIYKYYN